MTKKQRRKLEALVRKFKKGAKSCREFSKDDNDWYQGNATALSACAHYLEQFLEGK